MSALSIVAVVLLSLLLSAVAPHPTLSFDPSRPYPYLVADTFTNIKDSPLERLVLFYFSSSPASAAALSTLNTAARRLHQRLPHFSVQHVDGDLQANREAFISAGFSKPGQWLFTSTPIEGISQRIQHRIYLATHATSQPRSGDRQLCSSLSHTVVPR